MGKARSRLYPISIIMMAVFLAAGARQMQYICQQSQMASWVNLGGNWYWEKTDGTAYVGWLAIPAAASCYLKEDRVPLATGWGKGGRNEWYYFHEDGGMGTRGRLVLDNAVYEFEDSGALKTAK